MFLRTASSITLLYKRTDLCLVIQGGVQVLILNIQNWIILTKRLPDLFPFCSFYSDRIFTGLGSQYIISVFREGFRRTAICLIEIFFTKLCGVFLTSASGTAGISFNQFNLKAAEETSERGSGGISHLCCHSCSRILCCRTQCIISITQTGNCNSCTLITSDLRTHCIFFPLKIFFVIRCHVIICKYPEIIGNSFSCGQVADLQFLTVSFCHLLRIQCDPGIIIKCLQCRIRQCINGNRMLRTIINRIDLQPDFSRYCSS